MKVLKLFAGSVMAISLAIALLVLGCATTEPASSEGSNEGESGLEARTASESPYNSAGFDADGYDRQGFNAAGIHRNIQRLSAPLGASTPTFFGRSLATHGTTLIIASNELNEAGSRIGSVYIFNLEDEGTWAESARLSAGEGPGAEFFGHAVDISGDTAIVSANGNYANRDLSGSVFFFTQQNGVWSEAAELTASDSEAFDFFGNSIAISGNTAVVGAPFNDDNGNDSGSAYIFTQNAEGAWAQTAKLTASDAAELDNFGQAVAISENFIIVGAEENDDRGTNSGSAYIFALSEGGAWVETTKLTASDAMAGDSFGISVAISGNTAVVGALWNNSGSVYIFTRSEGGAWVETAKLTAGDAMAGDSFGSSVDIIGDTVAVAAPNNDGQNSGSVYIFTRSEGGGWTETAKLSANNASENDLFGDSLALSTNAIVVSAPYTEDNSGSAYIFRYRQQ